MTQNLNAQKLMSQNVNIFFSFKSILILFSLILPNNLHALPNVKFIETQVEFRGNQRSARLTLLNQGDEAANVEVKMQYKLYTDQPGNDVTYMQYVNIDRVDKKIYPYNIDLDGPNKMIRFSPRRAVIEPGQRQTFRIFLKKPIDMQDGEYTVYLDVHYLKDINSHEDLDAKTKTAIDIPIQFSYSIPLQIFHGRLTGSITKFDMEKVTMFKADDNAKKARAVIAYKRDGNASVGFNLEFYRNNEKEPFYKIPEIIENYRNNYKKAYILDTNGAIDTLRVVAKSRESNKIIFDASKSVVQLN